MYWNPNNGDREELLEKIERIFEFRDSILLTHDTEMVRITSWDLALKELDEISQKIESCLDWLESISYDQISNGLSKRTVIDRLKIVLEEIKDLRML